MYHSRTRLLVYHSRSVWHIYKLAEKQDDNILKVVLQVWIEILFYAANRCSGESHAKKISSGAELTTILWLMAENFHHYLRIQHVATS